MRTCICLDEEEALKALRSQQADSAIIEVKSRGTCLVYFNGLGEAPPGLTQLPGFRSVGVMGIPAPPVRYYSVARLPQEVVAVLCAEDVPAAEV